MSETTLAATSPPVPDLAAIEAEARQQGYAEAAERETCVWREYPLERLGLADGTRPTAEGQVLLDFLRNGGRLERRPDDLPLLRLGQRLREWNGIANGPFSYSDRKSIWIATFDCASHRH